ncbi:spore germination protein GerD [Fictibacillus macauensis ZFHKF-1]|uniref:Spore germination protein GerD n=1 Tax=Fictibacillus macauensis ZFHKF-1 TaxID=1196324 RepID=I8UAS2_9BACL|nr:spore germination lipoprotein GerD [Fictibacillus macauensis]EIT84015.1 spore germination protein GerD [Fictibacillus macauensis ZFHKF-1]
MKKILTAACLFCFLLFTLGGCAEKEAQGNSSPNMDYDATKKMLIDILKTDDGKKAMSDVLTDQSMKKHLLFDQEMIKQTIEKELLSKKGEKFWEESFKDPKFAATYAKSMKKEHEKLMKDLMKDPAYQAEVMKILKSPEIGKKLLEVANSPEYRKEVKKIMMETFQSPLVKAQVAEMLKKAAHEEIDQSMKKGGAKGGTQDKGEKKS